MLKEQKMRRIFLILLAIITLHFCAHSQVNSTAAGKHKIAIFTPLYLDSAFDANDEYRYAKTSLPKFISPGLEFYEGAQLALDSLAKANANLEVFIFDTRSATESLEQQLAKPELSDVELIIAHCTGNEIRAFADFALAKNIPFINTTVPNDAGITGNPYFVILNPTLKTQCEGIYKYIQKYYALEPIVVFRRKSTSDDMVKSLLDDYSKATLSVPLKMKYVTLNDSFTVNQLLPYLDSNRRTLCISGSLDVSFGRRLALQLASIGKTYPVTIMGMPTWEAISRDFARPEYKGIDIIYSTPFYNSRTSPVSTIVTAYFNNELYARPSDMVFHGYEVTWKFANLLMQYGKDISSNLTNKQHQVFTEYDIQPVINRSTMNLEYFENKKLYFLKWTDGALKVAN